MGPLKRKRFRSPGSDPRLGHFACSALAVALVLSLLFILLLRLVAGPLVLVLILGVLAVLAYGIYHCWEQYQMLRDKGASISQLGFTTNLSAYQSVQETWLAACKCPCPPSSHQLPKGCPRLCWALTLTLTQQPCPLSSAVIVLAVIEGILLLLLIFLRQRIRIAITLLEEASKSGTILGGKGDEAEGSRVCRPKGRRWQGTLGEDRIE